MRSIRHVVALLTFALAFSEARAQGVPVTRSSLPGAGVRPAGTVTKGIDRKELERFDPVSLLLSKKKDLKLESAQELQLASLGDSLTRSREPLLARIDSTQKANLLFAAKLNNKLPLAAAEAGRLSQGNALIDSLLVQLRERYTTAAERATAMLSDGQRDKATPLLQNLQRDMSKSVLGKAGQPKGG